MEYSRIPTPEKASIDDFESNSSLLEHGSSDSSSRDYSSHNESFWKQAWFITGAVMFVAGLAALAAGLWLQINATRSPFEAVSYYSPLTRHIDQSYHDVRFNGTLNHPSRWRGEPSPALDAAWDEYENVLDMTISKEDLVRSGADPDSVHVEESLGGGYLVGLEVTHQLHCLNFLRKGLYFNWDYYQDKSVEFTDPLPMVKMHLGHCLEMLRQNLICHSDVGVISHHWVKDYPRPYPDFNTMHTCRNMDSVYEYARESQLERPRGYEFFPLPGDKIWDEAP